MILSKTYSEPPFSEKEISRYAGCNAADEEISALVKECINEVKDKLTYRVCYRELPVKTDGSICDFEVFSLQSEKLALNLKECEKIILFAATIGVEIDRLITKYGRLSPSKALMLQAIGAERIEALCDMFCADIEREYNMGLKPRFSPGYGDLTLFAQKDIFSLIDSVRRIGLTLNDSLLMSPSKSVTAFLGLVENK
ncbi:MAG: Vitamin B12 dependent methionine synthase activation subunit [Clostridia bacterium]|nr:Vitamin B12 dependent methionine synthase activation subunit [Clostridia bacterium]